MIAPAGNDCEAAPPGTVTQSSVQRVRLNASIYRCGLNINFLLDSPERRSTLQIPGRDCKENANQLPRPLLEPTANYALPGWLRSRRARRLLKTPPPAVLRVHSAM